MSTHPPGPEKGTAPEQLLDAAMRRLAAHPAVLAWKTMPKVDEGWPAAVVGVGARVHALEGEQTICGQTPTLELGGLVQPGTPGLCELCDAGMRVAQETSERGYRETEDGRTWKSEDQEAWERGVARRLRVAVEVSDYTYARLARVIGVSHTTVERWVRGEITPVAWYLIRLGEVLDEDDPLFLLGR